MKLRPKNVSPFEWRKLVKLKTSKEFKVVSDSYKERRSKQIPHTTSRRGMVRLAEDMVWIKSRTRKDGTLVNTNAAEKIREASEIVKSDMPSSSCFEGQDSLSQLLGPDNPGRMRAMGRNMNKTKLACFQMKNKCMAETEAKQAHLQLKSVNKRSQPKCILIDWTGNGDATVVEGRIITSDPDDLVNDCRLGPSDVKVLVDTAMVLDTYLWRPVLNICTIESVIGKMIAWPASKCVNLIYEQQPGDIAEEALQSRQPLHPYSLIHLQNSKGKRSRPPIPLSCLADVPNFLGRPHTPTAYTPPWMIVDRHYLGVDRHLYQPQEVSTLDGAESIEIGRAGSIPHSSVDRHSPSVDRHWTQTAPLSLDFPHVDELVYTPEILCPSPQQYMQGIQEGRKRSIPPIHESHPADAPLFLDKLHVLTAYMPTWMMRGPSPRYLLPPSDPPDPHTPSKSSY
ncbi:putative transposase Ptta/En/Spm plant [Arabidopsis suecica]|uniref:Putative transposase Ptta/En/Spm plant n=1 Tax=Arabidopsis suecica TaxID=45249 RepID=A0A8T1XBG9_ARASU|nr:putative transposase Ptta/En/Spm plant [Arabidopsis suecica]KAG7530319.1 putative transposase Ptta/En/Spm plant [Arabidopsis suecica]